MTVKAKKKKLFKKKLTNQEIATTGGILLTKKETERIEGYDRQNKELEANASAFYQALDAKYKLKSEGYMIELRKYSDGTRLFMSKLPTAEDKKNPKEFPDKE